MNEPLLERISQLERSVRRWRLVSVCLLFLLILVLAVGVIFTTIPATREPGGFWSWLPWVRAREAEMRAREAEERDRRDRLEAVRALQDAEAERRATKLAEEFPMKEP